MLINTSSSEFILADRNTSELNKEQFTPSYIPRMQMTSVHQQWFICGWRAGSELFFCFFL